MDHIILVITRNFIYGKQSRFLKIFYVTKDYKYIGFSKKEKTKRTILKKLSFIFESIFISFFRIASKVIHTALT